MWILGIDSFCAMKRKCAMCSKISESGKNSFLRNGNSKCAMVILFTQWRFFLRNGSFTKEESSNSFCAIAKCLIFSHILFAQWVHIFCMSVLFPKQTKIWFCQLNQHQRVWPSQCVACGKDWKDFKSFSENSICAMSNRHVCKAWFAMFTSKNDFRYQGN